MTPRNNQLLRWLPAAALLLVAGVVLLKQQAIVDWARLVGYDPPAAVQALANDTSMTPAARHLFYLNHPSIDNKTEFAKNCPARKEQSVVIGCYHPVQRGISVLKVTDTRLEGIEEVTAAHEMLHAAYDRLSKSERARINRALEDFSSNGLRDDRIRELVGSYGDEERLGEMHSIFGTELEDLPAELQTYYARYFTDRSVVTAAAGRYTGAFTGLKDQIARYDEQLKAWKQQIDTDTASLEAERQALRARQRQLEQYEAAGDISGYNSAVPTYNASVDRYNDTATATRDLIAEYNQTVKLRNDVALEERGLQDQIDASVPAAADS